MKYRFLKFFLHPEADQGGSQGPDDKGQQNTQQTNQQGQRQQAFDYEKLASIVAGKQTVAEDTVLKNYFKQQGLSQEEAQQAMASFKAEKAKNTPDPAELQTRLAQANAVAQKAQIESAATLTAISLGLDAKTIPYVLKMADLSNAVGQDGKINDETIKNAVNKVLEDVPQLKPAPNRNNGFQIGGDSGQQQNTSEAALMAAFGIS